MFTAQSGVVRLNGAPLDNTAGQQLLRLLDTDARQARVRGRTEAMAQAHQVGAQLLIARHRARLQRRQLGL